MGGVRLTSAELADGTLRIYCGVHAATLDVPLAGGQGRRGNMTLRRGAHICVRSPCVCWIIPNLVRVDTVYWRGMREGV